MVLGRKQAGRPRRRCAPRERHPSRTADAARRVTCQSLHQSCEVECTADSEAVRNHDMSLIPCRVELYYTYNAYMYNTRTLSLRSVYTTDGRPLRQVIQGSNLAPPIGTKQECGHPLH